MSETNTKNQDEAAKNSSSAAELSPLPAQVCPECEHGGPHVRLPSNLCTAVERDAGGSLVFCNCRYVFPVDSDLPCRCGECGRVYRLDIQVPDDLWGRISHGRNLLCGMCILKAIEGLGEFNAFALQETNGGRQL